MSNPGLIATATQGRTTPTKVGAQEVHDQHRDGPNRQSMSSCTHAHAIDYSVVFWPITSLRAKNQVFSPITLLRATNPITAGCYLPPTTFGPDQTRGERQTTHFMDDDGEDDSHHDRDH